MNKLDLRIKGKLSIEEAKKITDIEPMVQSSYNGYIGELIKENSLHGEQWLLQVTCRNTYVSLVHDQFCRLALLEDQLISGKIFDEILLDDFYMRSSVEQILKKYSCNSVVRLDKGRVRSMFLMKLYFLLSVLKNIYFCFNSWFWVKFSPIMDVSRQPIILLDTFLVGNRDRYYNQLIDNLPFMMRDRVYYLPTLFGLRYPWEWLLKFREIAKSDDNMLLKEQWLKWSDYKDAFLGSFILSHSINKIPKWNNIDVSLIIRKEMLMDKGSSSITQSLLITRSFARYRVAGIKLKGVVDWFENQVIDRALALGVRENYPNVKIKGYMGYVAEEYYAGLTPTIYEKQEDLLPDELLMIGEAYIEKKKKKCPWLEVSVAPAFRFHNTMMFESNNITRRSDILLAMPMEIDECRNIINLALSAQLQEKHTWMLKVHPTIPEKKFKEMIPESSNKRFVFTDKSLTDLFESSKLLITSSSSVAIEAVVCGLFVAIIGDRSGPTKNPLLNIVDKSYWSVCYTSNELERVIKNDIQLQKLDKSKYLEKITEKGVIEMMEFS